MRPRVGGVIMAAGLLVLLGLGLFVAGIVTGTTALYWGCVAACVVAAALLFQARRQPAPAAAEEAAATPERQASTDRAPEQEAATGTTGTGKSAVPTKEAVARRPGTPPPPPEEPAGQAEPGEPPLEEVEVTDLLLVLDLTDEVLVVDEHPRYHLEGCRYLTGRTAIPLPLDEARTDGFTPCGVCTPDRHLADRARARK